MKKRKIPMRTCVGCRTTRPKRELIRIVRDPQGELHVDSTGKLSGRGAYICPDIVCFDAAVKGKRLEKALERPISPELVEELRQRVQAVQAM